MPGLPPDGAKILVTGGAGYIGSHTVIALINRGYCPLIVDNLSNSHRLVIDRIAELSGYRPQFEELDIRDAGRLRRLLADAGVEAAIHFAGLKAVGESVSEPLRYYDNNVAGTVTLLEVLEEAGCRRVIFSSSATVYGDPEKTPIDESAAIRPTNPYGQTKAMVEQILFDLTASNPAWQSAVLRYFNPVGAHPSGRIGEDPLGIPNNLMPYIAQVAVGRLEQLNVFGNDYPTRDGTGVRDYIHVMDLADGHVAALDRLLNHQGSFVVNLGTGRGYSVLEMVHAFEQASGRPVPYRIADRRSGDIATCFADTRYASDLLGWQTSRDLETMCRDHWHWQSSHPAGYLTGEEEQR